MTNFTQGSQSVSWQVSGQKKRIVRNEKGSKKAHCQRRDRLNRLDHLVKYRRTARVVLDRCLMCDPANSKLHKRIGLVHKPCRVLEISNAVDLDVNVSGKGLKTKNWHEDGNKAQSL